MHTSAPSIALLALLAGGACSSDGGAPTQRRPTLAAAGDVTSPSSADEAERMDEVQRVCSRKASSAMSRCWNAEYERTHNSKVEASVEVLIMVAPNGTPSEVKILANQGGSPELAACVASETRSWTYPEGTTTTPVTCRFLLRSSQ